MKVTDKELTFENKLIEKLDLMIKKIKKGDDAIVIIDGDEGMGKTNFAIGIQYYVASKLNRDFDVDNIYFDTQNFMDDISNNAQRNLHWDEATLGALSTKWWDNVQIKLTQLLMMGRKKQHFITMCIPRFNNLKDFFVVDRTIALIHVYARQNIYKGRFFYFTKAKKESLYDEWRRKRKRNYIRFRSFGGTFQKYMEQVFTLEQIKKYDKKKDDAILSLNKDDKKNKPVTENEIIKDLAIKMIDKNPSLTIAQVSALINKPRTTVGEWINRYREKKEGVVINTTIQ